jgi:hypothetical protein
MKGFSNMQKRAARLAGGRSPSLRQDGGRLLPGGKEQFSPSDWASTQKFYDWRDKPGNEEEWERDRGPGDTLHKRGGRTTRR